MCDLMCKASTCELPHGEQVFDLPVATPSPSASASRAGARAASRVGARVLLRHSNHTTEMGDYPQECQGSLRRLRARWEQEVPSDNTDASVFLSADAAPVAGAIGRQAANEKIGLLGDDDSRSASFDRDLVGGPASRPAVMTIGAPYCSLQSFISAADVRSSRR